MRRLDIAIDAGEKKCARERGAFCRFLRGPRCWLFEKTVTRADGWAQRLPECIAAEHSHE